MDDLRQGEIRKSQNYIYTCYELSDFWLTFSAIGRIETPLIIVAHAATLQNFSE